MLVNMDGKITDTIADTQVELGFILEKDGEMQELPGIQTKIPASERVEVDREREEVPEALSAGTLPKGFTAMEWKPGGASTGAAHSDWTTRFIRVPGRGAGADGTAFCNGAFRTVAAGRIG